MANGGKRANAGRPKGSKNKRQGGIADKLRALDCDPIEGMARLASGQIDCLHCDDKGMMTLLACMLLINSRIDSDAMPALSKQTVVCPICSGTKKEYVQHKTRGDMFKELAQYIAPKRRSIEVSVNEKEKTPDFDIGASDV